MKKLPIIASDRIRLKPLKKDDMPLVVKWRNLPRAIQSFFSPPPTLEIAQNWFINYENNENDIIFVVEDKDNDTVFGMISLTNRYLGNFEVGRILIGEDCYLGKGFGNIIMRTILTYGFNYLNAENIILDIYLDNTKLLANHRKMGFERTSSYFLNDREVLKMALNRNDFNREIDIEVID